MKKKKVKVEVIEKQFRSADWRLLPPSQIFYNMVHNLLWNGLPIAFFIFLGWLFATAGTTVFSLNQYSCEFGSHTNNIMFCYKKTDTQKQIDAIKAMEYLGGERVCRYMNSKYKSIYRCVVGD